MSRAYLKSILREVRHSLGRFLAIFGIVALGVGFLAGLWAATPDMHLSMDNYFDQQQMADVFIKSTMGLTEDDIAALVSFPQVANLLPAKVTDAIVATADNGRLTTRIFGLPWAQLSGDEPLAVNRLQLVAGRLPQTTQECLVEKSDNFLSQPELGTTLNIVPPDNGDEELYATTEFTVVGVVANPFYFSNEREPSTAGKGRLEAIIYIADSCYELDVYTDIYLTSVEATDLIAFSDAYQNHIDAFVAQLEELAEERSHLRYGDIYEEGRLKLDEARTELAAAEEEAAAELAKAWREISDARRELAAARQDLDRGQTELTAARATLATRRAEAEAEIAQAEQGLAQARQKLEQGEQSLAAALEAGLLGPEQAAAMRQELDYGWQQYTKGVTELDEARGTMNREMLRAEAEITQAALDLEQGESDYATGLRGLAAGEADYWQAAAEVAQELADARIEIEEAAQELGDLAAPTWYVLNRNANASYVSFAMNTEKVESIATVFPVFFMLVAALVSLASMTRMIEEERTQIGIMKALGYSRLAIMQKYIGYCGLASLAGSLIGLAVGFRLLPAVVWQAFAAIYQLPPLSTPYRWPFAIVATLLAIFLTMLVTIYACSRALAEKPAMLMRPRAPKAGRRILLERVTPVWSRLKFSHKATARNLFRYKKHFYMTIVGVAGCTALIVTGFGLRDSINSIAQTQFSEIMRYDLSLDCKESKTLDVELDAALHESQKVLDYMVVHTERATAHQNGTDVTVTIYVPQDIEALPDFINLRERKSASPLNLDQYSVVVSETLARSLGLQPGDVFILENADEVMVGLTVAGVSETYVGSFVYLTPAAYQAAFAQTANINTVLAKTTLLDGAEQDALLSELLALDAVSGAQFLAQTKQSFDHLLEAINLVVILLIFAAGALAIIVLYNLININIEERRKELATLRVLGFHHEEVAGYIFRETAILTIIGTLVGLLLGKLLHTFVAREAESTDLMLGQSIAPLSYLLSAALTLFFAGLVALAMYRKLKQIEMVESMKAIE